MPLCSPKLRKAAAALVDPRCSLPLIGRADWWALWFRALGMKELSLKGRIHSHLSTEYLDVKEAIAGHGIAIGSPILFRDDIDAGRHEPCRGGPGEHRPAGAGVASQNDGRSGGRAVERSVRGF